MWRAQCYCCATGLGRGRVLDRSEPKISTKALAKVSFYLLYHVKLTLGSPPSGQNPDRFKIHSTAGFSECVC